MKKINKRLLASLLCFCMLLTLAAGITLPATAAGEQITVATAEDLIAIANGDLSGDYIQTADIDLTGEEFTAIGIPDAPFTGTYDGNGYKITGLTVGGENEEYQGLFGVNNGTVRNVTLGADCSVTGSAYVGAIAGRNNGVIEDCISDAAVSHIEMNLFEASVYKIMSQNLCQWGDDQLAADKTGLSRRPGMISRIQNVDPDVICFQEVSFTNHTRAKNSQGVYVTFDEPISPWDTYLKENLTDYSFFGDYRDENETNKEGVTVAYKTEKFNCLKGGMFWLSENPDAPRSQQRTAWGAGCVRTCAWVLLEDKETGEQMAVYSAHLDHLEAAPLARANGAKVIAQKMEELKEDYPNVMFMVAGDYNEEPGNAGYNATEEIFNGMMDDARYAVEGVSTEDHTWNDNFSSLQGAEKTIDFIFADSTLVEVNEFQLLTDYYNNLRPSDHHGLLAKIEMMQNNGIGGVVGSNNGTVQRVIARGTVDGGTAEAVGQAIGSNSGNAIAVFSSDVDHAIGSGKMNGAMELPAEVGIQVVATLNREAGRGAFTLIDNEYVVVGSKILKTPVCLTVNGVDVAVYPGDVYTAENLGIQDPTYILDGVIQEGASIIVPENGGVLTVADTVSAVEEAVSGGEYTIKSMSDWMYLYENKAFFADRDVVIHLLCDLDFSVAEAAEFTTMMDPAFSFNGQGNTIKNWGTASAPVNQPGLFTVQNGAGGMNFIRNLYFENCHIWDSLTSGAGTALVYAVQHGNAGMDGLPTEFYMENIHVTGCSLGAVDSEANAFILSRYGVPGQPINVYLKNCSVKESVLDAYNMDHKGLLIGKVRSNAAAKQANFYMEDCILDGNTIKNSNGYTGFAFGNIEATGVDAYLKNVGIFNNTSSGTNDGAVIGHMNKGGVVCEGVLMSGNTLNQSTKYVIAAQGNNPVNVTTDLIFCDNEGLTGVVEGKSNALTGGADAVASGAAGYAINSMLENPTFYWAKSGMGYAPVKSAAGQVRKISIRNGTEEKVIYANGGETITLEDDGFLENYRLLQGNGTLDGDQLTVSTDEDTVLGCLIPVSDVGGSVSAGDYTVSSLEEWMTLYTNRAFFRDRDVTIHLLCDLDLSKEAAADFIGFDDPYFSFDGHGNTLSNWGTEAAPIESKGLFYATEGAGGLNYIKNIKLENCHLSDKQIGGDYGACALVYSALHGNSGLSGLPSVLTLENIRIEGCSVITKGEAGAVLLGRYAPASGGLTVNISNCRIEDTILDAGNKDHKGFLVGKLRSNNATAGVYNIKDCYLAGNTLLKVDDLNAGFLFGTAEHTTVTAKISNVGIVGNTVACSGDFAIVGYADNGTANVKNLIAADNHITAARSFLFATDYNSIGCGGENIYTDAALTAAMEYGTLAYTANAAKMASGEISYLINQVLVNPAFYWGLEEGLPVPVAAANQTAKLRVVNDNGVLLETCYLNGGSQKTFGYEGKVYELYDTNGGSIEGATLTMPEGGEDATVLVKEPDCEHQYNAEDAVPFGEDQHKIPCANNCGKEETEACSFGSWTPSAEDGTHFRTCVCDRTEESGCTYTYTHEAGADTHSATCGDCTDVIPGRACTLRADAAALPAIGSTYLGSASCIDGCGNTHLEVSFVAGDVNGSGEVSIADVVCILRTLSGKIEAREIHAALGNIHKLDGVTANGGLTTADARLILKHLLGE